MKDNPTCFIIPNYTNFGMAKDINRDSFLLVFKSFLDNTEIGKTWNWILPYPDFDNHPGIINQFVAYNWNH